ncbi:tetratricopeptide repeat protein 4 homolog isoform X2 [Ricinus communis]|uniref:tetratricopeptide repeat protein 4 homolog isoform X2 n=1 Tax=Ricinus communis TaxID=3988 RepID=UPI0007725707|nr:tetratricopeptide repeat protein 4 homolog isoform X2 [Ricinus communis]|eukprot:XP_015580384.1 tetratricopeptide repeat protein 4 homolog isoform X2 [Ricinus communis]
MALWLEAGSEPTTESEIADLEAINAIKESAALELKEQGNKYVKMGKKHYSNAIDCYTRAINQKVLSDSENSMIYSNRAHVNLLLGNYRRALSDAEEAIKLCATNVKALYRAAKASLLLNLLTEAKSYSEKGLKEDPNNEELKKFVSQITSLKVEQDKREAEVSKAVSDAKDLLSAIEDRGLRIEKAMFRELIGLRKPVLDKNKILHWPVLLLYPEVMSSDFIEDFCEMDMFSAHLDMMFSESSPLLQWDTENKYTREAIELYYEASSGVCLSRLKVLNYLLEGTVGANTESTDEEKDLTEVSIHSNMAGSSKWVKVNEKRMLHDVLKEPNFTVSGIPVFYVVSKISSFYKKFITGKWALPL